MCDPLPVRVDYSHEKSRRIGWIRRKRQRVKYANRVLWATSWNVSYDSGKTEGTLARWTQNTKNKWTISADASQQKCYIYRSQRKVQQTVGGSWLPTRTWHPNNTDEWWGQFELLLTNWRSSWNLQFSCRKAIRQSATHPTARREKTLVSQQVTNRDQSA